VRFFSMHPGWADTPGVQTSLPGFHAKFKDSLRTTDQGADTIVYLAVSNAVLPPEGESDPYNGKFFFDREVVTPFLASTGTQSSEEEVEALWQLCTKMTQLKE